LIIKGAKYVALRVIVLLWRRLSIAMRVRVNAMFAAYPGQDIRVSAAMNRANVGRNGKNEALQDEQTHQHNRDNRARRECPICHRLGHGVSFGHKVLLVNTEVREFNCRLYHVEWAQTRRLHDCLYSLYGEFDTGCVLTNSDRFCAKHAIFGCVQTMAGEVIQVADRIVDRDETLKMAG